MIYNKFVEIVHSKKEKYVPSRNELKKKIKQIKSEIPTLKELAAKQIKSPLSKISIEELRITQQRIIYSGLAKREAKLAEERLIKIAKVKGMTPQEYIEWSVDRYFYEMKKQSQQEFSEKHFNASWDNIIQKENLQI